jgi:hypothetical protein
MVVQHDYKPKDSVKYLGNTQTPYEKKNWSSVILFNNTKCKALTPEYINTASGLDLHQFKWLGDDSLIGAIPQQWNHLVGWYPYDERTCIAHFTEGGPWLEAYNDCHYSQEWYSEKHMMEAYQEWTSDQHEKAISNKVPS